MSGRERQDDHGSAAADELAGLDAIEDPGGEVVRTLDESDFAEIVQDLSRRRWTGTLAISHLGISKRVVAQNGRLVFASSTSKDDRMGELLFRRGRLTLQQYLDAGAAVQKGKRLGAVLVEQGVLKPEDLVSVVVDHTQEVIYSLFQWTAGLCRMKPGVDEQESITLKMSTPDMILEGIRRIGAWSRIERGLGGVESVYQRVPEWEQLAEQMTLPEKKRALLTALEHRRSVVELCAESPLPSFEVCRTLWAFRVVGVAARQG